MTPKSSESFVTSRQYHHVIMKKIIDVLSVLILFVISIHMYYPVKADRKSFKVHWNISNPIFRIDNTDNVFDINKGNSPWEHDQVDIVCPFYQKNDQKDTHIKQEQYIIYNVNKEEFDSCHIQNPFPRYIVGYTAFNKTPTTYNFYNQSLSRFI